MATITTREQALTKLTTANSNIDSADFEAMEDVDLIALASMVKVTANRGPSMQDRAKTALEALGKPVSTKELFSYMVAEGLATDGSDGTTNQFECLRSALTVGKNKKNLFANVGKGIWALMTPTEKLRVDIQAKLAQADEDTLEALWGYLND